MKSKDDPKTIETRSEKRFWTDAEIKTRRRFSGKNQNTDATLLVENLEYAEKLSEEESITRLLYISKH